MWVVIGSSMPAIAAIVELQPAVALTTCPALDRAAVARVRTPVARPFERSIPVTSVYGWISAPAASAPRAKPQTTASWRMIPPGGW